MKLFEPPPQQMMGRNGGIMAMRIQFLGRVENG